MAYTALLALLAVLGAALVFAARTLRTGRAATVAVVAVLFAATSLTNGIGQLTALAGTVASGRSLRYSPSTDVAPYPTAPFPRCAGCGTTPTPTTWSRPTAIAGTPTPPAATAGTSGSRPTRSDGS
jgi:hypothetical protein